MWLRFLNVIIGSTFVYSCCKFYNRLLFYVSHAVSLASKRRPGTLSHTTLNQPLNTRPDHYLYLDRASSESIARRLAYLPSSIKPVLQRSVVCCVLNIKWDTMTFIYLNCMQQKSTMTDLRVRFHLS